MCPVQTHDGAQAYTYDDASRIATVGSYSYTYRGLENKRVIVYNSANVNAPSATFNLYAPDERRMGGYTFNGMGAPRGTVTPQQFTNYLYLGNKTLSF